MSDEADQLKAALTKKDSPKVVPTKDLLSTGSVLLNLALSGKRTGGIAKGSYVFLAGDSDSGKTWLAKTILAEAARNKYFADYRLVWNDPETGSLMDDDYFFGSAMSSKLEVFRPRTVQQFYFGVDDRLKDGRPFIEVLDSMDSLVPEEDDKKFQKLKAAQGKKPKPGQKEETGSYGMAKAKLNSSNLRVIANRMAETGSILIIIGQLKTNIGFGSEYNPKTTSGGLSLKFYSHQMIWTSTKGSLKTTHKSKQHEIGIQVVAKVKKNRLTGRKRNVTFPIYHSYGIDDLGSCVDWLVEQGHWKKGSSGIAAKELGITGSREAIVKAVEDDGQESALASIVSTVWNEIEQAVKVERKRRYE